MSSTSILEPVARRVPAHRHRSSARLQQATGRPARGGQATGRPVNLGPGGLAQRRAVLEARWRDRLERVTSLSLAYHDAAQSWPAGLPPTGTRSVAARRARQLARQAVAERQALAEIEAALDRIADGRYGRCEQCWRPIAAALLAAQPQARYCAACGRQPVQRAACA
jgi:DnaK suppressor protein